MSMQLLFYHIYKSIFYIIANYLQVIPWFRKGTSNILGISDYHMNYESPKLKQQIHNTSQSRPSFRQTRDYVLLLITFHIAGVLHEKAVDEYGPGQGQGGGPDLPLPPRAA